jgi:hypothetical protein
MSPDPSSINVRGIDMSGWCPLIEGYLTALLRCLIFHIADSNSFQPMFARLYQRTPSLDI